MDLGDHFKREYMKINFTIPDDNQMHRFCIECKSDGVVQVKDGKQTKYRCNVCDTLNEVAIYFDKHKYWLDDDKELWHESSGVFVRNDQDKYLFYKRTEWPFSLTVPSGHVDIGESPKDAASRELFEETGIKGKLQLLGSVEVDGDSCSAGADYHLWHAFILYFDKTKGEVMISEEGENALWLTLDEAQEQGVVFVVDYIIKKYIKELTNSK